MTAADNGPESVRWYYKPWMVVCMLFLVLGPFGLPLLYRSPGFTRLWRIVLTAAMIPYTWFLTVATVKACRQAMRTASEIQSRMN